MASALSRLREISEKAGPSILDEFRSNQATPLTEEELYLSRVSGEEDFNRGVDAALAGFSAGEYAEEMLDAQRNQDQEAFDAAKEQRDYYANQARYKAPRVTSYDQAIESPGNLLDFAQQSAGAGLVSLAPTVAGGLIGRRLAPFRRLRGASTFTGAALPSYEMELEGAINSQYEDPALAGLDPAQRLRAARQQAALSAGFEAVVPAAIAGTPLKQLGKRILPGLALEHLSEAGTEAGQEAIGQYFQSRLNPNRDTSQDTANIKTAALGGLFGPGAVTLPQAGLARLAQDDVQTRLDELTAGGSDALKSGVDKLKGARLLPERRGKDYYVQLGDTLDQAAKDGKYSEALNDIYGSDAGEVQGVIDPSTDTSVPGDDLESILKGLGNQAATHTRRAAAYAKELLSDAKLPKDVRETVRKAAKTIQEQGSRATIAGLYQAHKAAEGVGAAVTRVTDSLTRLTAGLREGKKMSQEAAVPRPALEGVLAKHLKPELQANEQVAQQLGAWTRLLLQYKARRETSEDKLDKDDVRALFGLKRGAEALFADPAAFLKEFDDAVGGAPEGSLAGVVGNLQGATEDAGVETSFLRSMMSPKVQVSGSVINKVAEEIDNLVLDLSTGDVADGRIEAFLKAYAPLFGGAERAEYVLDNYLKQTQNSAWYEQIEDRSARSLPELREQEKQRKPAPDYVTSYSFERPEGGVPFLTSDTEGQQKRIAELKKVTPNAEYDTVTLEDYVNEEDVDETSEGVVARLRTEFTQRLKEASEPRKAKDKIAQAKKAEYARRLAELDEQGVGALKNYSVVRSRDASGTRGEAATDRQFKQFRKLVETEKKLGAEVAKLRKQLEELKGQPDSAKKIAELQARIRSAESIREKIEKTFVRFKDRNGHTRVFSAESMWKSMAGTEKGLDISDRPTYIRTLFAKAVGMVLSRPEFRGGKMLDAPGLLLDRKSDVTAALKLDPELSKILKDRGEPINQKARRILEAYTTSSWGARKNKRDSVQAQINQLEKDIEQAQGPRKRYLELGRDSHVDLLKNMREFESTHSKKIDKATGKGETQQFGEDAAQAERQNPKERYYDEDTGESLKDLQDKRTLEGTREERQQREDEMLARRAPLRALEQEAKALRAEIDAGRDKLPKGKIQRLQKQLVAKYDEIKAYNARIEASMVRYRKHLASKMSKAAAGGRELTPDERKALIDEIKKMRGDKIKVVMGKLDTLLGGVGSYEAKDRLIEIAINALDPKGVGYHEALHDFFASLTKDKRQRRLAVDLLDAMNSPRTLKRLRELLAGQPEALRQLESGQDNHLEERLAYAFQFWASGQLVLDGPAKNWFEKLHRILAELFGVLTADQRVAEVFRALRRGDLADPNAVSSALERMNVDPLDVKIARWAGPVYKGAEAAFRVPTDRMRKTLVPSLIKLADLFDRGQGREEGGLGYLQEVHIATNKYLNKLNTILEGTTEDERLQAMRNLQAQRNPSNELEREISEFLDEMFKYMRGKGVAKKIYVMQDGEQKEVWEPIRRVGKYFPRKWSPEAVQNNLEEFYRVFVQPGRLTRDEAEQFAHKAMLHSDSMHDLAETEHNLGYTPFLKAINARTFDFIDDTNAHEFVKFQSDDLVETLTTYIHQATHRAEYTPRFDNDGGKIDEMLEEALKEGATTQEIEDARKGVRALEGSMRPDMSMQLRNLMGGLITAQNVMLLPLSLFSSLVDPLGVAIRSNDMKEAWKAFDYGMRGIATGLTNLIRTNKVGPDAMEQLAEDIGLINNMNVLENMGLMYQGVYMAKWLKKVNQVWFKANGMETWNRRMRVAGMVAANRFIAREKNNKRYMKELGLESGDVQVKSDGMLKMTVADGLTKEQAAKMHAAVFKFVDGAVLRPNAAQRPVWGSDPLFMLLFHLKQFTFSFHNVILKRARNEFKEGNAFPLFVLASYVPFMAAADLARGIFTGSLPGSGGLPSYISAEVARAGVLGNWNFGLDAMQDVSAGRLPGTSAIGPTAAWIWLMMKVAFNAPGADVEDLLIRSAPASPIVRNLAT